MASIEDLYFQGEAWRGNCSGLSIGAATCPSPSIPGQASGHVFLGQPTHNLWQCGCPKRCCPPNKHLGSVLWLPMTTEAQAWRSTSPHWGMPCLLQVGVTSREFKWLTLPSFIFFFSLFWKPDIKDWDTQKQLQIRERSEHDHIHSGKGSEKNLQIIAQAEPQHRQLTITNKQNQKQLQDNQQAVWKGEKLISKVTWLLDSNVQLSNNKKKNKKHTKKWESMAHSKEKIKSTATVLEKDPTAVILGKGLEQLSWRCS